jgi:hypothetical protein
MKILEYQGAGLYCFEFFLSFLNLENVAEIFVTFVKIVRCHYT